MIQESYKIWKREQYCEPFQSHISLGLWWRGRNSLLCLRFLILFTPLFIVSRVPIPFSYSLRWIYIYVVASYGLWPRYWFFFHIFPQRNMGTLTSWKKACNKEWQGTWWHDRPTWYWLVVQHSYFVECQVIHLIGECVQHNDVREWAPIFLLCSMMIIPWLLWLLWLLLLW